MAFLASGCMKICGDDIVERIKSPSGKFDALRMKRNCGATTGFATHVNIVDGDAQPSYRSSGAAWDGEVITFCDIATPDVRWSSDTDVTISYPAELDGCAIKRAPRQKGIAVSYQPVTQ